MTAAPPVPVPPPEYQAAAALAAVLSLLDEGSYPPGVPVVSYQDRVANMVVVTVNGVAFHAIVTAA